MTIKVLLADDHAMMRDGLKALLEAEQDMRVVGSVSTGRAAVREASTLQPDVIIMDITMPDMNGIEAVARLKLANPDVRVIMLSMHSGAEHVHRAISAGAAGYLLKESAGEDIVAAVRAAHVGRRLMSRGIALPQQLGAEGGASPLDSLSPRERQVLQLVAEGHSSAAIAARIQLSPKSVDTYRSRVMRKIGVADVTGLVKFAVRHGLTPPE